MKYQYNFSINNKKLSFYSQQYIINHGNQYGLSYNGYSLMEVDKTEIKTAIKELTENYTYKGKNIIELMNNADKKEEERNKKNNEYWDSIHRIKIENDNRLNDKIKEIKEYFNNVLSKQYTTGCIVYNKLEESIKRGYFTIYTGYSTWKTIRLSDTPIKQLELLNYN